MDDPQIYAEWKKVKDSLTYEKGATGKIKFKLRPTMNLHCYRDNGYKSLLELRLQLTVYTTFIFSLLEHIYMLI